MTYHILKMVAFFISIMSTLDDIRMMVEQHFCMKYTGLHG
jgi:hypothetical protein